MKFKLHFTFTFTSITPVGYGRPVDFSVEIECADEFDAHLVAARLADRWAVIFDYTKPVDA